MSLPIYSFAFVCAFYGGIQLPSRIFYKFTPSKNPGITHAVYSSSQDMVSKFRLFETFEAANPKGDMADYLTVYGTDPLTKKELSDNLILHAMKEFDISQLFRVKRAGKDKDPYFWSFGKVHGLENLAFVDPKELKETNGNPVAIQELVNRVNAPAQALNSYEHLVQETQAALESYKNFINTLNLNSSDRKKLLSLPFYMTKRHQNPSPVVGQMEYDFFTQLYGKDWFEFNEQELDREKKINEFEYEEYFHPMILEN